MICAPDFCRPSTNSKNYECISQHLLGLKPIFHQNAQLLAGTFASANAKDSTFALPNAKNTNMFVSLALGDASFLRWPCTFHLMCVDFIRVG